MSLIFFKMKEFITTQKISYIVFILILLFKYNANAKIGDNYQCHHKAALKNEILDHYTSEMILKWNDEYIIILDHINETNEFSDLRFNRKYKIIFQNNISFIARNESTREGKIILHSMNFLALDKISMIMNASTYGHIYSGHYDCKKI
ncbi:hypothetical protein OAM56_05980 [Alphaproteobacteria bacterium]|nr:hypothetical protein [Alphaproteobacteria bacterium]